MTPQEKLVILREYERLHLQDMEDMALRGDEILREMAKVKEEKVKKYEETIAQRIELADPMLDITDPEHISSYIRRKYREHGVQESLLGYMDGWVEPEHKSQEIAVTTVDNGDGTQTVMESYEKPIDRLDSKELVEKDEWISEQQKKLKAELKRLADIQELVYSKAEETNLELPSMKDDVISTPLEESENNEFANALIKIGNNFIDIGQTAQKVKLSPEDAKAYSEATKIWLEILNSSSDLKNTKDTKQWIETMKIYEDFGKHAAAVKAGVVTINGVKRPLTREQVGDKVQEVFDAAIKILDMDHLLKTLSEYRQKYVEPRVAQRKVDLHSKLSERA